MGYEGVLNNYSLFLIGFIGAIVVTATFPLVESAIPPTPAFKFVNSEADNGNATATSFSSTLFLKGNGTVITNYLEPPVDWCTAGLEYLYRKVITIDSTKLNADETDFPLLFNYTSSDFVGTTRADGNDIIFCDSTETELNYDLDLTGFSDVQRLSDKEWRVKTPSMESYGEWKV